MGLLRRKTNEPAPCCPPRRKNPVQDEGARWEARHDAGSLATAKFRA